MAAYELRKQVAVAMDEGMGDACREILGYLTMCWLNKESKDNEVAVIILPCNR
jgi:hypothetical protein